MKQLLLSLSLLTIAFSGNAQTATNFTTSDCSGTSHDLFTELDAGKVVVITWVMPCSSCIAPAVAAQNAVNSFSASNPGQVVHYIADDYANSSCTTVGNWCTTNSLAPDAKFSSTSVSMSGYGAAGMPKIVVLGGTSHTVYYNQNGSSNSQSGIQSAITNALAITGVKESASNAISISASPNPVNNELTIRFSSALTENVTIEIYNVLGKKVSSVESTLKNEVKIDTEHLANGTYFAKVNSKGSAETVKFIVAH
ncbi:MAG: hypothetical protein K0S12_957 [Bacteroidetes bacterium]|jgi:hypothetical protein|nr:hypothetical protein [Bacteroidota bacterium]